MKLFISGWITTSVTTCVVVLGAVAVQAQTLVADEIRTPYPPDSMVVPGRGPYAPPGAVRSSTDEAMPAFEVVRIARATGYEPLGAPVRRNWVYTISAIDPDGYDGRLVLDARTGRIMRFIPAEISDEQVIGAYGPPGLPPPPGPPPVERMNARTSLRPPAPVPHVASRTPQAPKTESKADLKTEPRTVGSSAPPQPSTQARPEDARAEVKPAATARAIEAKPSVQLQPTQDMPPVQGLD